MKSQVATPSVKEAEQRVAFEALKNAQVLPQDAQFNVPAVPNLPGIYVVFIMCYCKQFYISFKTRHYKHKYNFLYRPLQRYTSVVFMFEE